MKKRKKKRRDYEGLRRKSSRTVMSARFHEDDIRDAVQQAVGPDVPVHLTPPCSCCNAHIAYARDHRALWIFPQLWPTTLTLPPNGTPSPDEIEAALKYKPQVVGFETTAELETFLRKVSDKDHYAVVAPILREAFAQGAN